MSAHNTLHLNVERKKPQRKERSLHRTVADFLRWSLPADAFFTTIPGGDGRATYAPGYSSGSPDILIVYGGAPLFVELKSEKGKVAQAQRETHRRLRWSGADVLVARSAEAVEAWLLSKHIPLRAHLRAAP
jgi:hypothetical protein